MTVKIESLFKELAGTAPDRKSVDKIMHAGRAMKLPDHDAFWLVLVAFEAQQAEVARTLSEARGLAGAANTAASNAGAAAGQIRDILIKSAPWLEKKVQDAAFLGSGELTGAIGSAAADAANTILASTQEAAARTQANVGTGLDLAARRASETIAASASAAAGFLDRATRALKGSAHESALYAPFTRTNAEFKEHFKADDIDATLRLSPTVIARGRKMWTRPRVGHSSAEPLKSSAL